MLALFLLAHSAFGAWQKILLTDAAKDGAVCLDGSPGGFYFQKGTTNSWVVFHQGGGWCGSDMDCLARSQTPLGSSTQWPATYTDTYEASALFNTPPFNTWNLVYAMYCDGSSWTSQVSSPVPVNGTRIFYRGRLLLDAMIDQLLGMGLSQATSAIYAGCSAGGLTAYLHADYFKSRVPASVNVVGLADAMFAMDVPNFQGGQNGMEYVAQWGYKAWNSSSSVPANCRSSYGESSGWRCLFGANMAQFVQLPMFIVNSKYDTWQQIAILGLNCSIGQCPAAEEHFFVVYGQELAQAAQKLPKNLAVFLTNCPLHCMTGFQGWDYIKTGGELMRDAFTKWFAAPQSSLWLPTCDEIPCPEDNCKAP